MTTKTTLDESSVVIVGCHRRQFHFQVKKALHAIDLVHKRPEEFVNTSGERDVIHPVNDVIHPAGPDGIGVGRWCRAGSLGSAFEVRLLGKTEVLIYGR